MSFVISEMLMSLRTLSAERKATIDPERISGGETAPQSPLTTGLHSSDRLFAKESRTATATHGIGLSDIQAAIENDVVKCRSRCGAKKQKVGVALIPSQISN